MGMAILFKGAETFEQIGNTLSTECPMWNLVRIAQAVSEEKLFKGVDGRRGTTDGKWSQKLSQSLRRKWAKKHNFDQKLWNKVI